LDVSSLADPPQARNPRGRYATERSDIDALLRSLQARLAAP